MYTILTTKQYYCLTKLLDNANVSLFSYIKNNFHIFNCFHIKATPEQNLHYVTFYILLVYPLHNSRI